MEKHGVITVTHKKWCKGFSLNHTYFDVTHGTVFLSDEYDDSLYQYEKDLEFSEKYDAEQNGDFVLWY
jgi:hypothetical protein